MVLNRLKTYILSSNESVSNVHANANKLSLNYEIIDKSAISLIKDETFIVLKDSFVVNEEYTGTAHLHILQELERFMETEEWDYIFLNVEPEILFHRSVKKSYVLYSVKPTENFVGYITRSKGKSFKDAKSFAVWPMLVQDAKLTKLQNNLVYLKNWYAFKVGFRLAHLLFLVAIVAALGTLYSYNFDEKFSKRLVYASFDNKNLPN